MAGRIPIMFEGLAGLAPGIQNGGVRVLGIASQKRLPNMPNLPTIDETVPGVISSGWLLLMAPAGTPAMLSCKRSADLRLVIAQPDLIERFAQLHLYSRHESDAD